VKGFHYMPIAWCAADAEAVHSHSYSPAGEFRRYFDVGVFFQQNLELFRKINAATGEEKRFVISELRYLLRHAPHCIPEAGFRTILKFLGYQLGKHSIRLPAQLNRRMAMNKGFFNDELVSAPP